jgi:hypothetical protein
MADRFNPLTKRVAKSQIKTKSPSAHSSGPTRPPTQSGNITKARG